MAGRTPPGNACVFAGLVEQATLNLTFTNVCTRRDNYPARPPSRGSLSGSRAHLNGGGVPGVMTKFPG
jgi:hypothetical protein